MTWVFVGGSQRSGTSVMQQLLCQSPLTNPYVFEASYLRLLINVYREAETGYRSNCTSYFNDATDLREFSSLLVRAFLEHSRRHLGNCEHLVLKEPHLTQVWPSLYELVPDSLFLLMVRDPRDVIASMIEVGQRQTEVGQPSFFSDRDIPELCRHFLSFYAPALNIKDPEFRDRLAIVLYENLVSDPRTTLADITRFTGIDFESIDVTSEPSTGHVNSEHVARDSYYSPWATELNGRRVSESRIGNYRAVLTPSEISTIETICAPFFDWFSYSRLAA